MSATIVAARWVVGEKVSGGHVKYLIFPLQIIEQPESLEQN
jgi:hypothetical protein